MYLFIMYTYIVVYTVVDIRTKNCFVIIYEFPPLKQVHIYPAAAGEGVGLITIPVHIE